MFPGQLTGIVVALIFLPIWQVDTRQMTIAGLSQKWSNMEDLK